MVSSIAVTTGTGTVGDIVTWDVQDDATPTIIGTGTGSVGNLNLTATPATLSKYLDGNTLTLTHDVYGTYLATVDSLSMKTSQVVITAFGLMGQLNVEKVAPPVFAASTLSDAYATYIGLCFNTPPTISYTATSNPTVAYPAWSGNVWDKLNELGAITKTEIAVVSGVIVIRDLGTLASRPLDISGLTDEDVTIDVNSDNIALTIELESCNSTSVDNVGSFVYNYDTNPSLETNATDWSADAPTTGTISVAPTRNTSLGAKSGSNSFNGVYNFAAVGGGLYQASVNFNKAAVVSQIPDGTKLYATISANASATGLQAFALFHQFAWYTSSGSHISTSPYTTSVRSLTTGWISATISDIKPPGAYSYVVKTVVVAEKIGTGTVRLGVDALIVNESPISYGDGNSPGWAWTGATNNSTSVKANATNTEFYNALVDSNNIITTDVNTSTTVQIPLHGTPSAIVQPLQVTSSPSVGQFIVTDTNGVALTSTGFANAGGIVSVALIPDNPGFANVYFHAPNSLIENTTGPYSIAYTLSGVKTAALSVFGAGVYTTPQAVTLYTAADPLRTQKESGASLAGASASPFITSVQVLRDRGYELQSWYGGPNVSIDFNLSAAYVNQFGQISGCLVNWKNNIYRVLTAQPDNERVRLRAISRVLGSDFDAVWGGHADTDFNTVWTGLRDDDFAVDPLRAA